MPAEESAREAEGERKLAAPEAQGKRKGGTAPERKSKARRAKARMPPRNWPASHSACLPCAIKEDVLSV